MYMRTSLGLALSLGLAVNAQQVNVRGKVSDAAGKAVANAVLELAVLKKKDTTGSDGAYAFNFIASALRRARKTPSRDIVMDRGVLRLSANDPASPVNGVFDVKGSLLERQALDEASAGRYFAPTGARLAKVAAAVDTLKVSAAGFVAKSVVISSFDTTVNVTLDSSGDYWGGLKNPARKSPGCGKATAVTNGKKTITSGGQARTYIIDIPAGYDMNRAYRFFYCSHWIGSNSEAVVGQNYYFLKPLAIAANEPAIFLAPQALPGNPNGTWSTNSAIDNNLFVDILTFVKENLCIDETRVFTTGFSFGGMMTYSLSENRQKLIRAGVGIAPANYNIYVPPKTREPIAWMQTTGMSDGTCPWVNNEAQQRGAKFIATGHAADNGCTVPANVPAWTSGAHLCYDFQGCKTGYPVKACTFGGGHTNIQSDPGSNANWIPQESWKFFTQF